MLAGLGIEAVEEALEFRDVDDVVHDAGGGHGAAELEITRRPLEVLHAAVAPYLARIGVRLLADRLVLLGAAGDGGLRDVAGLGRGDAEEGGDARGVLGVLADADVDLVV